MSAATAMIRSEARLLARNPGVVLWAAILPVAAAVVLGALPATRNPTADLGGSSFFSVYQPVLVLFAIAILAIQALPDVLTRYREMGVLKRLRTTPASPALLLVAQLVLVLGVSVLSTVVIVVVPAFLGAPLPRSPLLFLLAYLLSAWAFLGIGMVIASLFRNAKVAAGFGTVLFFVLQFFAGLWIQRPLMPGWMRGISDWTASGAASQALADAAAGHWPRLLHIGVLLGWGVVTSLLAVRLFRWE
ncbi:ABC transporter permease [Nakamurella endophytica]|uniref:Transport permease protein n=1 Tax=Nakamurella endophytica TaxID=1748367 RepID=A0A917SN93_9ACTN|nr:ABC transporter permease [Nakamurella endophytica]GGL87691.1 transport permease protein [Nakamurella endophytica]